MLKKRSLTILAVILMLSTALAACGNKNSAGSSQTGQSKNGKALGKKNIKLAYVAWDSAVATNNVVKQVLQNVGYHVTLEQTNAGPMYAGVANGSADAMVDAWLPTTDASYWKKYKNQLVDVGILAKSCPEGLVVPKYMKINSVKDLATDKNHVGEKTNWTITGIDAGAGEMNIIRNKMMKQYGLNKKWHLQASSDAAMIAALKNAIDHKKPIITVLWRPHWAFSQWNIKFLKDPKNSFKKPDDIHVLARKGLKKDSPAAYQVLKQFHWSKSDMEKVMSMVHKGMKPKQAAKKWIKNNPSLVKQWTKGVK